MAKQKKPTDPFAAREAAKYDNPIPSREFILQFLKTRGKPATFDELLDALALHGDEQLEALRRRLGAMQRDGQLMQNRRHAYGLIDSMQLIKGRVLAHKDGYGFLVPDEGGDDLFLNAREMRRVFDGDRVLARVVKVDSRGRREGAIVEILAQATQQVVGRYTKEGQVGFVTPDNRRLHHDIVIPPDQSLDAEDGQIVVAAIDQYPTHRRHATGHIIEILGVPLAPGMEVDIAVRSYDIPHRWSDEVSDEVDQIPAEISAADRAGRVDLRHLHWVTIDGADAKDFDDAVYCEPKDKGGYTLWVAIADVSHYVKPDSPLDIEAAKRGNSVYFPEYVVPMLPEVLSNGLCSLKPQVDRLCMVAELDVNRQGRVTKSQFYAAVMHSKARLTYTAVSDWLEQVASPEAAAIDHSLHTDLQHLHDVYELLLKARMKRGAIEFETVETRLSFGEGRKIDAITPVQRRVAHRLIEECMLAANVAAAAFLQKHKMPFLYRVHAKPRTDKITEVNAFLAELGLSLPGGDEPTPADYARLLSEITARNDKRLIQTVLLRSLCQAEYSPENCGHFGLAYAYYAHFTSPIRRYPDLLLHRALKHAIAKQPAASFYLPVDRLKAIGEHCSYTERRADEATRDVIAWLKCEFMQEHVGREFAGIITGVTGFGLFVELSAYFVEGLLHVTALRNDYYRFDPVKHRLTGERSHESYRLGDPINVLVAKVNLDDRQIDFELPQIKTPSPAKRSRRRRRSA